MQTVKISALVFGFALMTAACGDKMSSLNPTGPSAVSPGTLNVEANAADVEAGTMANGPKPGNGNGNGNANGNGNGNDKRPPTNTSPNPSTPVPPGKSKVEFEGLVEAVNVDLASLTVSGQLIKVTSETVIRHGNRAFVLSDLHRDDRVHVRANRVAAAATVGMAAQATLEATEIRLQNPGEGVEPEPEPVPEPEPAPTVVPDPLVSVMAFDNSAIELSANSGTFRLTRTGTVAQLALPLSVVFSMSGTATSADYAALPVTIDFPANQSSVDVTVMPVKDNVPESPESVVMTLDVGAGYDLGSPSSATIALTDEPDPVVTVVTADGDVNEFGNFGAFTLTRTGNLSAALSVSVEFSGTATGADYRVTTTGFQVLSTTITFAAGSATAMVLVLATGDGIPDPSETVIITVLDGASYDAGAPASASLTISGP